LINRLISALSRNAHEAFDVRGSPFTGIEAQGPKHIVELSSRCGTKTNSDVLTAPTNAERRPPNAERRTLNAGEASRFASSKPSKAGRFA
jgi:hypothetical protein